MLNYKLLIVCICIVVGLNLYLFFWNRFVAYVIGRIIRFIFWNCGENSIWVELGSIHFSLIAGRILFKDLQYHSSNQTIKVVKGQISWRYWLRAPAGEEDLSHARVMGEDIGAEPRKKATLACRLHMSLQGLEWFIYNRTAAYDNIVNAMQSSVADPHETPSGRPSAEGIGSLRKIFSWSSAVPDTTRVGPPVSLVSSIITRAPSVVKKSIAWGKGQLPTLDPKELLPIGIEVDKAAIMIGNAATPTLLVAEFQRSEGTYGVVPARSKHDLYKNVLNLTFQNASICYVNNADYDESAIATGEKTSSQALEDETPLGADFSTMEYAKESKILEAPIIEMLYYADAVGFVPEETELNTFTAPGTDPFDIGNGDLPPEWGVDLAIKGGFLRYGPWADRQRAILQQVFFPPNFADLKPHARLKPGDQRMWTCLKMLIELRDGVTLQIPFREPSKNWQWDGEVQIPNRPRKRDAASIHVRAGDSSTISYMLPMIATERGYEPTLNVHLDTITVTSSLNDIRLITAESCVVRCELPSTLRWNDQRQWTFTITLRKPLLFLLRDHINMFTDLGKDWGSGPPTNYNRFVPIVYMLDIRMENYELNTYVNDHNIIDKPLLREDNALLSLCGTNLQTNVSIPFTKYRPSATPVSFVIEGADVVVSLALPKWNTRSLYSRPHWNSDIGRVGYLRVDVSYCYHSEVRVENVDQLRLEITAKDVVYKMCGWTIRHFMILRNNYFGAFTHFSTLYEYLQRRRLGLSLGDPVDLQYREGSSNALQVHLGVMIDTGLIIMPAGLRGYERDYAEIAGDNDIGTCVMLSFPEFQLYLRTHDYFMEMSLNVDSIYGTVHPNCSENLALAWATQRQAKETFVLDGLDVLAHRLFGPQPHTTTYLCIWEIHAGAIKASLGTWEARVLKAATRAFGLNFTDPLNAPAAEYEIPSPPDVTFVKITLDALEVIWNAGNAAVEVALPRGFRMDSNDLAGKFYSKVTSFRVPSASLKVLFAADPNAAIWHEALEVEADANIDMYSAPSNWSEKAKIQSEFLAAQDSHTGRAIFLYMPDQAIPYDALAPGRGLLDTEFYIPQLRVPKPMPAKSHTPRKETARPSERPNGFTSRLHAYSESEEEEWIPEAARDARLAKSRPVYNLVHDGDDGSMSSGDESDNESLSDSGHSTSEFATSPTANADGWPAVKDYTGLIRSYERCHLHKPIWWTKSPFHLSKDRTYTLHDRFNNAKKSPSESSYAPWDDFRVKFREASNTSITRMASNKGIVVWLSPLILPVMEVLLQDMRTELMSPELCFDDVLADHIQSVTSVKPPVETASVMDFNLTSVQVSMLQSVRQVKRDVSHREDEATNVLQSNESTMDCLLKGFHVKISKSTGPPAVSCSLSTFTAGMGTIRAFDEACLVSMGQSTLSLDDHSLIVSLGALFCETGDRAAEHIFATAAMTLRCAQRLQTLTTSYTNFASTLDLHMLVQTIVSAKEKPIVDPLSAIQPSFLIQSGRPHRLRTDILFKYLVHLRNSLQHLNERERRDLISTSGNPASTVLTDEVKESIEEHLIQFGADAQSPVLPTTSLLKTLFSTGAGDDQSSEANPVEPSYPLTSISVKLDRVHTILRSSTNADSEFIVEPFIIAMRLGTTEQHPVQMISTAVKSSTTLPIAQHEIRHLGLVISAGKVVVSVNPGLIQCAQAVLRISRRYRPLLPTRKAEVPSLEANPEEQVASAVPTLPSWYYADVVLATHVFKFRAGAENLIIEYEVSRIDYASTLLIKPMKSKRSPMEISMNHSLSFLQLRLQALAVADISRPDEYGVLAAFIIDGGRINTVLRQEPDTNAVCRVVLSGENVLVNIPRSAMRLYRFMEEWRADYLPGIESMVRSLLSELSQTSHKNRTAVPSATKEKQPPLAFYVDLSVGCIRVSLQVMRGTWLAWEFGQIITYFYSPEQTRKTKGKTFGFQIASQTLMISSKSHSTDTTPNVRVKMPLPTFSFAGNFDGKRIESLALLEYFSGTIKPAHWDTLLSVQQKFGQDFNDLVALIAESRRKRSEPAKKAVTNQWKYRVLARMKGFSIGLDGVSSILFLDCDHVGGTVSNDAGFGWHIELADLALSLAPHTERREHLSDSHNRSVFVVIDARAEMRELVQRRAKKLDLRVTKIHAVMQPSSIGQLGDFVDHLQAEILIRKEQRAQELAEFKEKTKKFMRTFEVKSSPSQVEHLSWFSRYTINVVVKNIGVAFPLAFDHGLQVPYVGMPAEGAVRAFLFAIKSVSFGTQRGESGQASMKGFSFQFVSRFRQNMPQDFSGEGHATRNRLLYPEMTAQLRADRAGGSRQIHIAADVDGFLLDIESSIPDYVSSLVEVYRQGKERVDRLAGAVPRNTLAVEIPEPILSGPTKQEYDALPTSNVFLALTFRSGRVRMFSEAYSHATRARALSAPHDLSDGHIRDLGAEIFDLPVVSVWGEYRATPASTKVHGKRKQTEPSTLVFKSTVHSSQNTLRPTLLPFITEVVNHVEERLRKTSGNEFRSAAVLPVTNPPASVPAALADHTAMPTSSMQISLSLRIDQSKLELTCQPDVNVVAGLNWDSGGFVVNISPGAHRVTFSGSVGGLTVGLKHGFLSEDCMKLHARNLAFSVDFAKARGQTVSSVSVVCDTEFSGGVRFSRLQDILCFKAVWLDRIPVFNVPAVTPGSLKPKAATHRTHTPSQGLSTVALVRLRRVELDVDLGQSISSLQLKLSNAVMRTRIEENVSEVSLSVYEVFAVASGNLAGRLAVPDFLFQTTTRKDRLEQAADTRRMLDLRMTSGPLEVELESEYQKILLYRAEPLNIRISDDWSMFLSNVPADERRVRLTFKIEGSGIIAVMNVGTVPRLVSYGSKFKANLDAQKEGASRESQAFRISNSPKPENALSEVANAMFSSARNKLKESDFGFSCVIGQRLSLKLKTMRLVIFPRSMSDPELAQFTGSQIHAQLDRIVESDTLPPERDLQLYFSSIAISKLSQLHHGAVAREQSKGLSLDTIRWITLLTQDAGEATIFSLPTMNMHMHSKEFIEDGTRVLPYDFSSEFTGKHGAKDTEDIYITLNMSLYAWLTILRKTFAREMEQVRLSAEAQIPFVGTVQPFAVQRRKHAELLADKESQLSSQSPEPVSPPSLTTRFPYPRTIPQVLR
ncbi:hypothetical protein NM688_g3848 [Phlebia brevispora]|uniref:Uncharacterized protein n=1 Tax=Phlebia brevispora TaxID=194682 RepID=A0ACC1T4K6_9APHY|nr:hypothetical protein NM688_g3848 [Phlebia brevispora]